jgi:hypothetical protein
MTPLRVERGGTAAAFMRQMFASQLDTFHTCENCGESYYSIEPLDFMTLSGFFQIATKCYAFCLFHGERFS